MLFTLYRTNILLRRITLKYDFQEKPTQNGQTGMTLSLF